MPKVKVNLKSGWKDWVKLLITVLIGIVLGAGVDLAVRPTNTEEIIELEATTTLELAEEQVEATVVNEEGQEVTVDIPTVEAVDGGEIPTELEQLSDAEQSAQGFAIDISTPWTVIRDLNGKCIVMGNKYGSQCVNTTNVIAENQVGYWFSTCNTGAARGMWDCRESNARGGYELITDPTQLRPGDLFVTWGGDWGHTGMVAGYYNNGYVPVFSTNQGGSACVEGGAAANTINLSMATFSGAFRWHGWDSLFEKPAEPVLPISNCKEKYVEKGDTLGKYMLECENTIVYGEAMDAYAKTWFSKVIKPGQSVYEGWHSASGVGLYYTDTVEHRTK